MSKESKAADAIIRAYENMNEMQCSTGFASPTPIEESTDHAVVLALWYRKQEATHEVPDT